MVESGLENGQNLGKIAEAWFLALFLVTTNGGLLVCIFSIVDIGVKDGEENR